MKNNTMRDTRIQGITELKDGWATLVVLDLEGVNHFMDVKQIDLVAYQDGAHIQDAFPYLTVDQRELILTGMTEEMWNDTFGDEEE
jgi:hypothetical protein